MSRGKLFQTGFFRIVKRDGLPPAFLLPKFRKTDTIDQPEYRERNRWIPTGKRLLYQKKRTV